MRAQDIMTKDVIWVGPETSVAEVTNLMLKHRISAVPVVDDDGNVVGIVSEGDLIRRAEIGTERSSSWWLTALAESAELAHDFVKSHGVKASEIMTPKVIAVGADTPIAEIAETLEHNRIKRVPVIENGKLAGIVSRANILRALSVRKSTVVEVPLKDDRAIRDRITETLAREPWANPARINVLVSEGRVSLWGMVDSEEQRKALRVVAENVPGVTGIDDHTGLVPVYYGAE